MHQQPRATEQPFALKIDSRSGQREGVSGLIASMREELQLVNELVNIFHEH